MKTILLLLSLCGFGCVGSVEEVNADADPGAFEAPPAPTVVAPRLPPIGCWAAPGKPLPDGTLCLSEDTVGPQHLRNLGVCVTYQGIDSGFVGHFCDAF